MPAIRIKKIAVVQRQPGKRPQSIDDLQPPTKTTKAVHPRHAQIGHTWHKFALTGTFSETAWGFYTGNTKRPQRPKGRDYYRPFFVATTCKMPTEKASSTATSDIYTRRFRYSTHATNTLTTGAKVFSSDLGQGRKPAQAYRRRSTRSTTASNPISGRTRGRPRILPIRPQIGPKIPPKVFCDTNLRGEEGREKTTPKENPGSLYQITESPRRFLFLFVNAPNRKGRRR